MKPSARRVLSLLIATSLQSFACGVDEDEPLAEEPIETSSEALDGVVILPEIFFSNERTCWGDEGDHQCTASKMLLDGCDNRNPGPTTSTVGLSPWQSVGRFVEAGCTGTLISSKHVLTAAHCMFNNAGGFRHQKLGFRLGQYGADDHPYGTRYAKRVFIPKGYVWNNNGSGSKIYDYAVVELARPINGATTMKMPSTQVSSVDVSNSTLYTVGYPGDLPSANSAHAGRRAYGTAGELQSVLPHAFGTILEADLDGAGGQSGSAVYIFLDGVRTIVGVLIGSAESVCEARGVTWSPFMSQWALDKVIWPAVWYNLLAVDTSQLRIESLASVPADLPAQ